MRRIRVDRLRSTATQQSQFCKYSRKGSSAAAQGNNSAELAAETKSKQQQNETEKNQGT